MEIDLEQEDLFRALAICLVILLIGVGVYAGYSLYLRIYNSGGNITTIGFELYEDSNGTIPLTFIDFGDIGDNETKNTPTYYLINDGSQPINDINATFVNWVPAALRNLSVVSWNYNGTTINVGEQIAVYFTMNVSDAQDYEGSFIFETVLTVIE